MSRKMQIGGLVARFRVVWLFSALALVILFGVSFSDAVKAISGYDDLLRTTDSLVLKSTSSDPGTDITSSWYSKIKDTTSSTCTSTYKNSLVSAMNSGEWGISLYTGNIGLTGVDSHTETYALVYWTDGVDGYNQFGGSSPNDYIQNVPGATPHREAILYIRDDDASNASIHVDCMSNVNTVIGTRATGITGFPYDAQVYVSTFNTVYPSGYGGGQIDNGNEWSDTDGDGLTDYIESQWYPNRQAVFCGTSCAYPNPTQKDLYIEVDWMKNGNRTIKPSASQLAAVTASFANQGITAHFDTGQYGGGNELSVYANELYFEPDVNNLDFFDLKNGNSIYAANFNQDRDYIWHYMISGYKAKYWDTDSNQWITNSSGVAYAGDDDILIATGHIEDDQTSFNYNNLDTALSGTIIHEIGHSICLTKNAYTNQSVGCQFNTIDTWADPSYDSVMNYTHQMFQVDYSNGANGSPDDHNDWMAVLNGGLKDFTDTNNNSGDSAGVQSLGKKDKKKKVARGITSSEAKALKKAGKLGGKYKSHDNKIR